MRVRIRKKPQPETRTGFLKYTLFFLSLISLSISCVSDNSGKARSLSIEMQEASDLFFAEVARSGSTAQSYFTLFLPEDTVNPRHWLAFRAEAEKALRKAASVATMHYNASAERVFFLSKHKAEGWNPPADESRSGELLATELRRGTAAGWTILHTFWGQFNRLLIGDDRWIQNLPESVRADLSHPLRYVVRISVALESSPNMTTYIHRIGFELVEVGKERTVFSNSYPLVLSYPLI
ncbi:MAG: hypothetical protein ABIK28_09315 [Planctomycetota bacterium]